MIQLSHDTLRVSIVTYQEVDIRVSWKLLLQKFTCNIEMVGTDTQTLTCAETASTT